MNRKPTKYTKEFKLAAVKLVTEQQYSQAEAAKNLGINAKNLSRWIKEASQNTSPIAGQRRLTAEAQELQQLRKENKRLKLEREILKKATAFFANESH
jgi:transposase